MKKVLLKVDDLHVSFSLRGTKLHAVRGINFEVDEGEAVGIVGESGCGKSTTVQAIAGLTSTMQVKGQVFFDEMDLLHSKKNHVLGTKIGMVFQDPMTCLNPTMNIGDQIEEGILYHRLANRKTAKEQALQLLSLVGVNEPEIRLKQYPHQLSGGMRQRVLIAIALACRPQLLIADEPTTALDMTIQMQILELLKKLQAHFQMSLILITHDLGVVAQICKRVLVMYAGKIVEEGKVEDVLTRPQHPYTQMLLDARPSLEKPRFAPLQVIEGAPPNLISLPRGCAFRERCPYASDICKEDPPFLAKVACWRGR